MPSSAIRVGRRHCLPAPEFLLAAPVCAVVASTIIPATSGFRMTTRFATALQDLDTQVAHWREGPALGEPGPTPALFGRGVGTFPRRYLSGYPDQLDGVAMLRTEADHESLELVGRNDVKITRRLALPAYPRYRLTFAYGLGDPWARLRLGLWRRQLIEPLHYNAGRRTVDRRLGSTGGRWPQLTAGFANGPLGDGAGIHGRAPLLPELGTRRDDDLMSRPPATLAVDNLSLVDDRGQEYLVNDDFSARMDHRFPLHDFNHLPRHIKDLFVHLCFEQGWLGLLSCRLLFGLALGRGLSAALRGDVSACGLAIAVAGFCTVGAVGTLLEEPPVLTLLLTVFVLPANARGYSLVRLRAGTPG